MRGDSCCCHIAGGREALGHLGWASLCPIGCRGACWGQKVPGSKLSLLAHPLPQQHAFTLSRLGDNPAGGATALPGGGWARTRLSSGSPPVQHAQTRKLILAQGHRSREAGAPVRRKGQQVALGLVSHPSSPFPCPQLIPAVPQKGPAHTLGPGTTVPPAGDACQSHSLSFCIKP